MRFVTVILLRFPSSPVMVGQPFSATSLAVVEFRKEMESENGKQNQDLTWRCTSSYKCCTLSKTVMLNFVHKTTRGGRKCPRDRRKYPHSIISIFAHTPNIGIRIGIGIGIGRRMNVGTCYIVGRSAASSRRR